MSEEEKLAIEDLKSALRYKGEHIHFLDIDFVAIETVLNLIEKQQKEIEKLKFTNKILDNCLNDFYGIKD